MARKDINKSIESALKVLYYLKNKEEAGIREISRDLGISKSTVQRIINSFHEYKFVRQNNKTGKYELGLRFFEFAMAIDRKMNIAKVYPYLQNLAQKTGETVQFALKDSDEIVYVEVIQSTNPIGIFSAKGIRKPIYYGALGQIILAYCAKDYINKILYQNPLVKFSSNTLVDPDQLKERLKTAREKGYLVLYNDPLEDSINVAAPVLKYNNIIIGGVACGMPLDRGKEKVEMVVKEITACASSISSEYGYFRT